MNAVDSFHDGMDSSIFLNAENSRENQAENSPCPARSVGITLQLMDYPSC